MGFMPLSNPQSSHDTEIPLSTVRSNASSSGARKPNQGLYGSEMGGDNDPENEKKGLFHRKSSKNVPAGRRKAKKDELKRQGTGGSDEFSLNAMGRVYNKIVGFSVITRYLVYVLPVAILLAVPLIILPITGEPATSGGDRKDRIILGGVTNADGSRTEGPSLFFLFVWIEVSWLFLWAGKIVAHLLPSIFMFFCGVVSSGTRKYATVLKALEIQFSLFFWGLGAWLSFQGLIYNGRNSIQWTDIVFRILLSLFISSAILLVQKAFVQLISISYHQRSFANRIKESKHEIHLLGLLYDASRTLFPMYCEEFADEDYAINDSIDMVLSGGKSRHRRGGSVTPMRLIGDVGRFGDKITSVFGNIAHEITGKQVFNPNSAHSIVVEALEKIRSSEALARRIWMSFVVEGKDALTVDDVVEVLGPAHREEAEEAFESIDADQNGDISLDEMVRKVVDIGKERKAIANSMKDISQALAVFDNVLLLVVLLLVILVFLIVFQSSFVTSLATAATTFLSLSFVFAVTAQEFLGSCIFLFVKHPYDVGDRVDITGPEKEQLIVEKISLLYTVFTRIDRMQIVQVPNITLNNLWIENVTRSKAMKEVIDINVSYDTSFEDIELLRLEMEKFVRAPENSRDFQPDISVGVGGVGDLDKLNLKIAIKHKSNWHNEAVRVARRSKFMCALTMALKKVPIYNPGGGYEPLGGANNPAYSVAVTDEFAAGKRSTADKNKQAKRMVPVRTQSVTSVNAEQKAAEELNMRDPVADAIDDWGYEAQDEVREPSADATQRQNSIAAVRDQLHGRESQRGRRKPGEGLPAMPLGENAPGVSVTQYNSNRSNNSGAPPRGRSFDVESQQQPFQQQGQVNYPTQPYGAAQATNPAVSAGYSVFPPARAYSPPGSSAGPPHPLQSAPTSRSRGPSLSRPMPPQQQQSSQGIPPPPGQQPGRQY